MRENKIKFFIVCTSLLCLFFTSRNVFSASIQSRNCIPSNRIKASDQTDTILKVKTEQPLNHHGLDGNPYVKTIEVTSDGKLNFYGIGWTSEEKEKTIKEFKESPISVNQKYRVQHNPKNRISSSDNKQ